MSKYFGIRLSDEDVFYLTVIKDKLNELYPFDLNDTDAVRFCLKRIAAQLVDKCCDD